MQHRLAMLVCLSLLTSLAFGSEDAPSWILRKDDNGIRVYTREQPGSSFEAVRTEMELEGVGLAALVALINDPDACALLESRCAEAYVVERIAASEQLVYRYNDMPFPVKDRDVVLNFVTQQDPNTLAVTIQVRNVNGVLPENPRRVRLPSVDSGWVFTPLGDGRVEVVSEGHIDPGASLPAWMLNRFLIDAPFKTMEAVAASVGDASYRNAALDFIQEPAQQAR
jgi:hypothetical protein